MAVQPQYLAWILEQIAGLEQVTTRRMFGGVGLYNGKTTIDGLGSSDSETKFGANAGAGFDFKLGAASLYAEGRFHAIFKAAVDAETLEETTAYMIPLTVGLRF